MNRRAVGPWSTLMLFTISLSMSTDPLERSVAFAIADSISFFTGRAAARLVNWRMPTAWPTDLPRTSAATTETFRGAMRRNLRCAVASMADPLLRRRRGRGRSRLGDLLLGRVADEGAGGAELSELVTDHVLGDVHGDELAPVVHRERVTDELGRDGRATRPRLDDRLLVALDHRVDLLRQMRVNERTFAN